MRLNAALEGNLEKILAQEMRAATVGVREGLKEGTHLLKTRLRSQVARAGLGGRLAKAWQSRFYDNDHAFNVAGLVYSKARRIMSAFAEGVTIRAKRGKYLAIPTPQAPRLTGRRRTTPSNWDTGRYGPLRYVPGSGSRPPLLVADEQRVSRRTGRAVGIARRTKTGKLGRGAATVVMFVLVPQVRLRKRLNIDEAEQRLLNLLPRLILRRYRTPAGEAKG